MNYNVPDSRETACTRETEWHSACGKVILFGEHAVVYGTRAIAAGLPDVIRARAQRVAGKQLIEIPAWNIRLGQGHVSDELKGLQAMYGQILQDLNLSSASFHLHIDARIPLASGLGGSAALAVASIRALSHCFEIELSIAQVNDIAFHCECIAHGTPSGLDNTLATYGGLQLFQRIDTGIRLEAIPLPEPLPLLILHSGRRGLTRNAVTYVRQSRKARPALYDGLFQQIDDLSQRALNALVTQDRKLLGRLMNENHALLCELGVSCSELEYVIAAARQQGALGAKLTGSGQGGAAIACFEKPPEHVQHQLQQQGVSCQAIWLQASSISEQTQ